MNPLQISPQALRQFCERWKIREFAIFGSALREDFGPDSDFDVLVSFAPDAPWTLLDHVEMQQELEALLGRQVDLVSRAAIEQSPNWIRRAEILSTAQTLDLQAVRWSADSEQQTANSGQVVSGDPTSPDT